MPRFSAAVSTFAALLPVCRVLLVNAPRQVGSQVLNFLLLAQPGRLVVLLCLLQSGVELRFEQVFRELRNLLIRHRAHQSGKDLVHQLACQERSCSCCCEVELL